MDWDYTLPKDEYADYVWGGQWISIETVLDSVKKSPFFVNTFTAKSLEKYHSVWNNESELLSNLRPFHNTEGSRYGLSVEKNFEEYIKQSSNFSIESAGRYNDHIHRTDYFLTLGETTIPVDVKALKSVRDGRQQNKYFWVELHKNGFLFSPDSRSTILAVECFKQDFQKFVLLDKSALKNYVAEAFRPALKQPPVMNAPQAFLRSYRRKGERSEWLGFVEFKDCLESCAIGII
jgi:hypothetical protein